MKLSLYFTLFSHFIYTFCANNLKLLEIAPSELSDVMKKFMVRVIQENCREKNGFLFIIASEIEPEFSDFASQKLNEKASVVVVNLNLDRNVEPLLSPNHFKIVLGDPKRGLSHASNLFKKMKVPRTRIAIILTREPASEFVNCLLSESWKIRCINIIVVYESRGKIQIVTYNPYLPSARKTENLNNSSKDLFYDKTVDLHGTKIKCLLTHLDKTKIKRVFTGTGYHYEGKDYVAIHTLLSKLNGEMEIVTMDSVLLNPWFESIIIGNRTVRKKKVLDAKNISLLIKSEKFTTNDDILDNLYPHTQNDLSSVVHKSPEISIARSVTMITDLRMWTTDILIALVVVLLWAVIRKFHDGVVDVLGLCSEVCRLALVNHMVPPPARSAERLLVIFWILTSFIINTFLQSKITSYLAIRRYYPEIDTIEELFSSGLPLYSINNYIEEIENKFAGTPYELYAKSLIPLAGNEGWLDQLTYRADVSKMPVFFTEYDLAVFVSRCKCYRKNGAQVYHLVKESIIPNYQSYKVVYNSPLYPVLNRNLRRLIEGGFIALWAERAIFNATVEGFLSPEEDDNIRSVKPITLQDILTFFYILCFGYLLSAFFFIGEMIVHRKTHSKVFTYVN